MATQGAIVVDKERCKGCGVCVVNCPTEAIALSHEVNGLLFIVLKSKF